MLAAALYYWLSEGQLVKQASSTQSFFNLEMYTGTTDCNPWYACLYQKSTGAEPTVSGLRCDCSDSAGRLSRMTRNPPFPEVVAQSNWCASAQSLQKYAETLPPLISAATAKAEFANVFNFFSSKASCAAVATATSISVLIGKRFQRACPESSRQPSRWCWWRDKAPPRRDRPRRQLLWPRPSPCLAQWE